MVLDPLCGVVIQILRLGTEVPEHHVPLHLFPVRLHCESPSDNRNSSGMTPMVMRKKIVLRSRL